MRFRLSCSLPIRFLFLAALICGQDINPQAPPNRGDGASLARVPAGVIFVKGARSSASDALMPVPEGGSVVDGVFNDRYFAVSYGLPAGWTEQYKGPPPSDSGRYVLLQLIPGQSLKGRVQGSILFTAQDMFFTMLPVTNAKELINYMSENLQADYQVEMPPSQTTIANRTFAFFAYWSPVAQLHWYVLATEIRCHAVQVVLTSPDAAVLKNLMRDMNKMKLPVEADLDGGFGGGAAPVCIKDYARDENVIAKASPILSEHRFNPVPVRIIIDKGGKVKHIHFLSAFDDQAKAITDALGKWKFKQYKQNGHPLEVETGILFGLAPRTSPAPPAGNN